MSQLNLFESKLSNRVIITWNYHDAGYYWKCPLCPKREKKPFVPGYGNSVYGLEPILICSKCAAMYQMIYGDVDSSDSGEIKYGYIFLGEDPMAPEYAPE